MAPEIEDGLRLPFPAEASGDPCSVDATAFVAWHQRTGSALASGAPDVPTTVYRIWLHRVDAPGRTGRAVYFQAGGEDYAVFASLTPTLVARKLPEGWLREKLLPAQKETTGYAQTVIPRLEQRLPGVSLRPNDDDGNIPLSPGRFDNLFRGTDVELERLPFAQAFDRELQALAGAAAHAASCGRPLLLRHF